MDLGSAADLSDPHGGETLTTAARVELSLRTIPLLDAVFAGMSRADEPDTRP
ncbi:MAG: hypothetical protein ACR2LK_08040 [Solirubrobacteraceae bacterium]